MAAVASSTEPKVDPPPVATAEGKEAIDPADAKAHPPRIQVSLDKKPLYFYVNLAKKLMQQHGEVKLSALGFAMSNMVSVAEILKKEKLVLEKQLMTSIDMLTDRGRPRAVRKPKMEIVLVKSAEFDAIVEEQAKALAEKKEREANAEKESKDTAVEGKDAKPTDDGSKPADGGKPADGSKPVDPTPPST
ncbi:hypothetical protein BSKO_06453 [Bryopsis sp. KO-2023]|nr:hypothetical protein BSKO_06453 [Bryopsis sp. KO-2023]